jgi:hypothetical protein
VEVTPTPEGSTLVIISLSIQMCLHPGRLPASVRYEIGGGGGGSVLREAGKREALSAFSEIRIVSVEWRNWNRPEERPCHR